MLAFDLPSNEVIDLFSKLPNINVNTTYYNKQNVFTRSIENYDMDGLDLVIQLGMKVDPTGLRQAVNALSQDGETALTIAVTSNDFKMVKKKN